MPLPCGIKISWKKRGMSLTEKQMILDILADSDTRMTPRDLMKQAARKISISNSRAKQIIKELTLERELAYSYFFGSTFIEASFLKAVRITDRFVLRPPGTGGRKKKSDIEIHIDPGISFGSGRHPTTRLCLEAMDHALLQSALLGRTLKKTGMDIGTGSGVLAIAMVKAGITSCLALDTDPVCRAEAEKNIRFNGLEKKIRVTGDKIEPAWEAVHLVCANLRFPTLKGFLPLLRKITVPGAILILSGIRSWELDDLLSLYFEKGFGCLWQKEEKNWSGVLLTRH